MSTSQPLPALPDERLAVGAARLATRHAGRFSAETIQGLLADSYRCLDATARVTTHLVVLAERLAAERLDALVHIEGAPGSGVPRVLFVCSHNAGRSQLAAALLAHRAAGRVVVSSAGAHPAAEVEPYIAQVLTEAGADTAAAFPKPLTDEVVRAADIVITMGCGDACPVVPGRRYLDWPVPGPGRRCRCRPADPRRHRHPHHRPAGLSAQLTHPRTPRKKFDACRSARLRAVRLRPQRRPLADGRRFSHPSRGRADRGSLRRLAARRPGQLGRRRSHGRARHRHRSPDAQGADDRGRPGVRLRHHHGLRRRLPDLPRQEVPRLGPRRPSPVRASRPSAPSATRSRPGSRP